MICRFDLRNTIFGISSLLIAAALTIGAALWGQLQGNVPKDTKSTYVTVQGGDTLWGIISAHDTRDNMDSAEDWVRRINHIHGDIQPGEVLQIPVGR